VPDLSERFKSALPDCYVVEREIGRGGMATVFLAEDLKHDRKVAIKVLHPELAAALGPDRFLREIRITAGLQHPNILVLLDSGDAGGLLYYVMPYVEGESLRELLERDAQLPLDEALRITREVAEGLDYAHRQNVIHRDIKPENILLSTGHAMIADFGVAAAVEEAGGARLTQTGMAVGTPAYMSPEQGGAGTVNERSDVYALGCVVYEMLAGQPPLTGVTPQATLARRTSETPPPLRNVRGSVSARVDPVLCRALDPVPADRYATAGELARSLTEAIEAGDVPARARSSKPWPGIAGALVLAVLAAIWLLSGRGDPPDNERVAVAVFDNQTGDPSLDLVGRMAQDWITQSMALAGVVEVVPTTTALKSYLYVASVAGTREGADPIRLLADETGAGTVVSGAYYRRGDSIQFQAQITDAARGRLLTALEPVSAPIGDPLEAVDRLGRRVTGYMAVSTDPRISRGDAVAIRPPVFEAYQEAAQGLEVFIRGEFGASIPYFLRAAALDSAYTSPRAMAAAAYMNIGRWAEADSICQLLNETRSELSPIERQSLDWKLARLRGDQWGALEAARQAIEISSGSEWRWITAWMALAVNRPAEAIQVLEPADPERGFLRGFPYYYLILAASHHLLGDHERELELAQHGTERDSDLRSLIYEVRALAALGHAGELNERLDESLNMKGGPPHLWTPGDVMLDAATALRAHGYRAEARPVLERALAWYEVRPPDEADTEDHKYSLGLVLYESGRWDEAEALFRELSAGSPTGVTYRAYLGLIAARRGDLEAAEEIDVQLAASDRPYLLGHNTYWRSRIAAVLGDRELAVRLLREALSAGQRQFGSSRYWVHSVADFESLVDYAPYQELVRPKE
jgi:serine/threonine protein kinase/tetratricopeptide (TPR) repeat protein